MAITSSQTGAFTSAPFLLRRRSRFVQSTFPCLAVNREGAIVLFNVAGRGMVVKPAADLALGETNEGDDAARVFYLGEFTPYFGAVTISGSDR